MMIARQEGWLTAPVGRQLVMMSVGKGSYVGLNEVGARIWQLLETPMALPALCAALALEFDVTAEACRPEVEAFLAELEAQGAIRMGGT